MSKAVDEKLMRAYIGKKAEVMYPKVMATNGFKLNIWALLFGPFYLLYRKIYWSILLWAALVVLSTAINLPSMALNAVWVIFYPLYRWDIERKLEKLKMKLPRASEKELVAAVAKKGGVCWWAPVAAAILLVGVVSIVFSVEMLGETVN